MNWKTFLKSKLLLLSITLVWTFLALAVLPYQVGITLLGMLPVERIKRYRWGFWIAQDQMVNAIHGGNPDVTVSSKIGYMAEKGSKTATAMAVVVDWIFEKAVGQKNHCYESIERDEEHYE